MSFTIRNSGFSIFSYIKLRSAAPFSVLFSRDILHFLCCRVGNICCRVGNICSTAGTLKRICFAWVDIISKADKEAKAVYYNTVRKQFGYLRMLEKCAPRVSTSS